VTGIALPIVKYTERVLSNVHRSAVKTISMLLYGMAQVRSPNLSEWARQIWLFQPGPDGKPRPYSFKYKKFRIWRFLTRSVFSPDELWESLTHEWLDPRDTPDDHAPIHVTLDWTQLGKNFRALVLALPYHGRAIPLAVSVLAEEYLQNEMTKFEIDLVNRFLGWLSPELRSRIVVLADRGFAKTELFKAIEDAGAGYVIRLPRDHHVRVVGEWTELRALSIRPGETRTYPQILHTREHEHAIGLVVRRLPDGQANDPEDDTWYLATHRSELSQAADWYALRFRTEELFKDWKSILDAAQHRLTKEEAVAKLVAILGVFYSFVVLEGQIRATPDRLRQVTQDRKGKPELGIFRQSLAILILVTMETVACPWDLLMSVWVQVH
jgi:hypothetical protein